MKRTLYIDPYVRLVLDEEDGIVRYERTTLPFPGVDEIRAIHDRVVAGIPWVPGVRLALLLDVREAPPRNDDEFEREIARTLGAFLTRFVAHATLVKSATGLLQARRIEKARGASQRPVFDDEAAAIAYLKSVRA